MRGKLAGFTLECGFRWCAATVPTGPRWSCRWQGRTDHIKSPRRRDRRGRAQLILAGQVNHVVGEVELHFVQREIREGNLLRVDRIPIAVIAVHGRATVGVNL